MRSLIRRRRDESRPDPAPSVWAYRLERMMLTPGYRIVLQLVLPFLLSAGAAAVYLQDDARRMQIVSTLDSWQEWFETRPEFMVNVMTVHGVSAGTEADIREVAQLDLPMSSFDVDLDALRANIATLPAVRQVSLQIRKGGELQVTVRERIPVALWRSADGIDLVDAEGVVTGAVTSRSDRLDLPLLAGHGTPQKVAEALGILAAASPVEDRLRGLVRMGGRRWDVVLDRGQRIMLPETDPVQAFERVLALHQVQDVLSRDLAVVDMRLAHRPTIRMTDDAVKRWWAVKELVAETRKQ